MTYIISVLIVMFLVTAIPRAIPIVFVTKKIKSRFIKDFLYYMPYAVLSALTFPYIFYCCSNIYIAIIGTVVVIILALLDQKLYITALVAIIIMFILTYIF